MAGTRTTNDRLAVTKKALALATEAMDLLDAHGVAPDASAHFALAQERLRQILAQLKSTDGA